MTDRTDPRSRQAGPSTVLVCRAPHPRAEAGPRFQGRIHGVRIQIVPFEARPTYRQVDDWSDANPGCLVVRCPSCGAFTEYAPVNGSLPVGPPRASGDAREPTSDRPRGARGRKGEQAAQPGSSP